MNVKTLATIMALVAAPAAWAGSLADTAAEPIAATAAPYEWKGFYTGLSAGQASGGFDYIGSDYGTDPYDLAGKSVGGFVGYNFQRGSIVYGIELALQNLDADLDGFPEYHYNSAHDLKLRLGYAADNVLFYAFAGRTKAEWYNDGFGSGTYDVDGTNMGLGVEMAFRENWLVGLELIHRSIDDDFGAYAPGERFESDFNTVQFRAGYKF